MEKQILNNYKNYFKLETSISKIAINHHFSLYRELAETHKCSDGIEYCLTPNNSFPNFIFNEDQKFDLDIIPQLVKSNKIPPFWITTNKKTVEEINKSGFKLIRSWPLLAMDKNELIEPNKVESFKLTKVKTTTELMAWKDLVELEYNYNFQLETLERWLNNSQIDFFIGKVNNIIVSATLNFTSNNVVGFHFAVTKSEHRKKGIGMQTAYHSLNFAFKSGCIKAIASSTELGINPWKKIGYNVLDDKLYINWYLGTHPV